VSDPNYGLNTERKVLFVFYPRKY